MGTVKRKGRKGIVDRLYLEAYTEAANKEYENICKEVKEEYMLNDMEMGHVTGMFKTGESII